jgi:cytochrome b6-f complex iron-sulfur subunit/menaquinol-cytochrome c reductase iron-sulfur subunit
MAMPDSPGRRGFFTVVTGLAAAVVAGVAAVPVLGAVLAPLSRKRVEPDFVPVGALEALPEGRPVRAVVVGPRTDAWIRYRAEELGAVWLRRSGDRVEALSATCPHLGCSVERRGDRFLCPCHDSAFDFSGKVLSGPAGRPLDALEVRVEGGEVRVRFVRFAPGGKERQPA